MANISSRDLRTRTAEVLRRVEAGERLLVIVNRRPVAELIPLTRPTWATGRSIERVLAEVLTDAKLTRDLAPVRKQVGEPR